MRPLRLNFADTPFINRKVPSIVMGVVGGLAAAGLVLNLVLTLMNGGSYFKQRKALREQAQAREQLETRYREATGTLGTSEVQPLTQEALFLKGVLEQKKFSWGLFLDRLEQVKPYKAIFESIKPKMMPDGNIHVKVKGLAQPREEIFKLQDNVFRSEYFGKPELNSEALDKQSSWQQFEIEFVYFPEGKK